MAMASFFKDHFDRGEKVKNTGLLLGIKEARKVGTWSWVHVMTGEGGGGRDCRYA